MMVVLYMLYFVVVASSVYCLENMIPFGNGFSGNITKKKKRKINENVVYAVCFVCFMYNMSDQCNICSQYIHLKYIYLYTVYKLKASGFLSAIPHTYFTSFLVILWANISLI